MINTEPIPQFTPSRVDIENFPSLPLEARNDIYQEANSRFDSTLDALDAPSIIARMEMGEELHLQRKTKSVNSVSFDQDEYTHRFEQSARTTSEELKDPHVLRFLEQAVALKIHANRQKDAYISNHKMLHSESIESFNAQIEILFQHSIGELYKNIVVGSDFLEIGKLKQTYQKIEELDDDSLIPGDAILQYDKLMENQHLHELEIETLRQINLTSYIKLAEYIASECVKNSYLESLFEIFADSALRKQVELILPQGVSLTELPKSADQLFLERLAVIEIQIREYIQKIYGNINLPSIQYVREKTSSIDARTLTVPSFIDTLESRRTRITGVFRFKSSESGAIEIPDSLLVEYNPSKPIIRSAETLFEELYHASGLSFQYGQSDASWPGWKQDGTDSLLEEGLTGAEKIRFFKKYFPVEFHGKGSSADMAIRYFKGEKVIDEITDIWPGMLVTKIINRIGKGTGDLFREARMNKSGAIGVLIQKLDQTFGDDTYHYLSHINGHDISKVKMAIRKLGLNN